VTADKKTLCPYCGVGCGIIATTEGDRLIKLRGNPKHPANQGKLCMKGALVGRTLESPTRLGRAMIRGATYALAPTSSEHAITEVATRLARIRREHGPEAIAFYLSGQLTTEAQYLANKFAKAYLGTNHVDSNSRLCMASAAAGMMLSLGADGPPVSYADIELADTYVFIGSNAADCHPIMFERVAKRVKKDGARAIVVDPRRTETASIASLHLPIRPGTDLPLLNGLLRLLADEGKIDEAFIAQHTEGWEALRTLLDEYPAPRVASMCGVSEGQIREAARILGESERLLTFWTMGINQTMLGTFSTNAIINLHLATGQIGKPGAGPFSLTGQPNAMGGRDVGYMSHMLPGHRKIADPEARREMERLWDLEEGALNPRPGYDAVAMFEALARGEIKALWIMGTNPAASMPNLPVARQALSKAEFVIVQDAYYPTETTAYAHVVLPAAVNLEQFGTFTNSERCVSLMEEVLPPPGDARPDWWWVQKIAAAMGFTRGLDFASAAEIYDDFARTTAGRPNDQSGMSHARLAAQGPMQWPCSAGGEPRPHYDGYRFATPSGKARFWARSFIEPEERPTAEFPLLLTTGRVPNQWHTRTKTGTVERLNRLDPGPYLQIHPEDAASLGLGDGQRVALESRRGVAYSVLRVSEDMTPGLVFMPMHWNELWASGASVNEVTSSASDPISKEPSFKYCAVRVSAAEEARPEVLAAE